MYLHFNSYTIYFENVSKQCVQDVQNQQTTINTFFGMGDTNRKNDIRREATTNVTAIKEFLVGL